MYVTTISTKTESCDEGLYTVLSKKKPTEDQIAWYVREHGEKFDGILYEYIIDWTITKINTKKVQEWPTEDPDPDLETL